MTIPRIATIVVGQGVWAAGQAITALFLVRFGSVEQLGLYSLGLSIYAPACLALGFNLRVLVAIDNDNQLSFVQALRFRFASVAVALLPAIVIMFTIGTEKDAVIASLLLLGRMADQVADLTSGFHQRHGNHESIGASWAARGIATSLPLLLSLAFKDSLPIAAALSSICALLSLWLTDIKALRKHPSTQNKDTLRGFLRFLGTHIHSAPYPFIDSLFYNSLRYSIGICISTEALGFLAVAQIIYTPVQLLISAIGYTFLTDARAAAAAANTQALSRLFFSGLALALLLSTSFFIITLLVPGHIPALLFGANLDGIKVWLVFLAIAVYPLPFVSFCTMISFSIEKTKLPTKALLISLSLFVSLLCVTWLLTNGVTNSQIMIAFATAGSVRLLVTVYNLKEIARF